MKTNKATAAIYEIRELDEAYKAAEAALVLTIAQTEKNAIN